MDWFINRTNAGDVDSVLATFGPNATLRHADTDIPPHIKYEFLASSWYIAGYIHLRVTESCPTAGGWWVTTDVTGTSKALVEASGLYVFHFALHKGKITTLTIETGSLLSPCRT
ncbi:hypothetical protein [Frigoribacterium sp. R86507]|uniref:hypothetical protein n=1 Tax=Frigoribacterium sp. R86507 TaxID=3093850 RepID=UPI0037CA488E